VVGIKNIHAVIPPLGYVVGFLRNDYAGLSWHAVILEGRGCFVNEKGRCYPLLFKRQFYCGNGRILGLNQYMFNSATDTIRKKMVTITPF